MGKAMNILVSTVKQAKMTNPSDRDNLVVLHADTDEPVPSDSICLHLLSVLLCTNITRVSLSIGAVATIEGKSVIDTSVLNAPPTISRIINRHLQGDRDILLCQDELIEAGFAEWAKL